MPAPSIELGPFRDEPGYAAAAAADSADELAGFRDRFVETDSELIYLDGNSLGRLPKETITNVDEVVRNAWGDRLIRSWKNGWWNLPIVMGDRLAPLVGARPGEVLMSDSTSVNLYKLASAALDVGGDRRHVVTDDLNFPSDVHVLDSVTAACGGELEVVASDGVHGPVEAIEAALDERTALLSLSLTTFKSSYTYDLARLTARAHEVGALVLWDLSHSVGSVEIDLVGAGVDLAVGCTYKYLNGGPGSPAFLFVRDVLQAELRNPVHAWWGHDDPFGFELGFTPAPDIARFQVGTMPILSLVGAGAGIDLVVEAGMPAISAKAVALVGFAETQWRARLEPLGFGWASPTDAARRGAHVSLAHPAAWQLTQALIELGNVVPDFRTPDNLRLGFSPLTTSFVDVHTAIERLRRIVQTRMHERYQAERRPVT